MARDWIYVVIYLRVACYASSKLKDAFMSLLKVGQKEYCLWTRYANILPFD